MYQALSDPDVVQPAVLLALIVIAVIILTAMTLFRNYWAEKLVTDLKLDMLDRGMSAVEIERVIAAKPGNPIR